MISILSFIVVLGVIVFVHELGHFIAAKLTGVRVETFSLGFPPKMISKQWGETKYQLAWIPLGGYCKMSGMVDESLDDKPLTGASWEFMSKNALQKTFVISAGVIMNALLGFLLYTAITLHSGIGEIGPAQVGSVEEGYPADSVGMLPGDLVVSINGTAIDSWEGMAGYIHEKPDTIVTVSWEREGELMSADILTTSRDWVRDGEIVKLGIIGIGPQITTRPAGFFEAVKNGAETTAFIVGNAYVGLKMLFTGKASVKDFVGPVGLVHFSGETARSGLVSFVSFIAMISIYIGFFNLLPIPVLDGGHLVYILIEAIIRRPISTKVKLMIQQVGMAVILVFMLVVAYNDVMRFFLK